MEVGAVGGNSARVYINSENSCESIIRNIFTLVLASGYGELDANKFKEEIEKLVVEGESTVENMLMSFNNLDMDTKKEILKKCCNEKKNLDRLEPKLLSNYDITELRDYTPNDLKKQLRYRENYLNNSKSYNDRNFMYNNHTNNKRRKRR